MKHAYKFVLIGITVLSVVYSCNENPAKPDYQKEICVFGYLWGNERLTDDHAIMITFSQPITDYYDLTDAAVTGAVVTITDPDSVVYVLNDTWRPGFYFNDSLLIKPKTTYSIRVEINGEIVTASTTVPPLLTINTELRKDSINYVARENLGYEKPIYLDCELEDQIILVDMFCNEDYENAEYIKPFNDEHKFPDNQEEYDGGNNGEPRHIQAIVPYKDLVSDEFPGQYVVYWYHSMIVFYGSNTMQALAIDDNYHNFLYTEHPEFNGGINGGIGVFGSVCGENFELMVLKD